MSTVDEQAWAKAGYCDYCEEVGHTFRTCAKRDDVTDASDHETWGDEEHYGS